MGMDYLEKKELKQRIMDYFKTHKKAYWSDLAIALSIVPHKIAEACLELEKEGLLGRIDNRMSEFEKKELKQ